MENEIIYFTKIPFKWAIATHPRTGSAVVFNRNEQKWIEAPQNYFQIIQDTHFEIISKEQAQEIFHEIFPDDLLNNIDKNIGKKHEN
jgi:hypothetical protein